MPLYYPRINVHGSIFTCVGKRSKILLYTFMATGSFRVDWGVLCNLNFFEKFMYALRIDHPLISFVMAPAWATLTISRSYRFATKFSVLIFKFTFVTCS